MVIELKYKDLHRVAVTGIVYRDDGKFLITRRALTKKSFPGKWTVPGGGLETEDYIHEKPSTLAGQWYNAIEKTLRREIKEEVNIEVDKIEYLIDIAYIIPDGTPSVVLSYSCHYASGEVKYDPDTIDHAWVTSEEAKTYDMIDGIPEEIEMVDKKLKSNS